MDANKILGADILDIIFEGKNKDYGAYDLRKTYNRRLTMALIITVAIALLIFLITVLASAFKSNKTATIEVKDVTLTEVKKDKPLPPPPPKIKLPPPPKIETIKFTPPKVVKDNEVKPDEKPPVMDSVKNIVIAAVTQQGVKSDVVAPPVTNTGSQVVAAPDDNQVFTKVEKEASFPGGFGAWARYLQNKLDANVPVDNQAPEGNYTVIVQFVVSKDGSISNVQALTHNGYGMEAEAIRCIKAGPNWVPGLQNGRNVNSYHSQPITFVVTGDQ